MTHIPDLLSAEECFMCSMDPGPAKISTRYIAWILDCLAIMDPKLAGMGGKYSTDPGLAGAGSVLCVYLRSCTQSQSDDVWVNSDPEVSLGGQVIGLWRLDPVRRPHLSKWSLKLKE